MRFLSNITGLMIFAAMVLFFTRCETGNPDKPTQNPSNYKESLIKANQEALKEENGQIDDYILRHGLKMETTSTGIRIMFTRQGIGAKTQPGMTVKLSYTVTLLTGDTVYTAMKDGPLVFVVGKGQVISGLEEAILLFRVGDRAKIIIPSHLAYGLIGDQKKILHKASLVYDIELISMY